MKSHTAYMTFETRERRELIRITEEVQAAVDEAGIAEGMVLVSAMHITAGVWVNDDEPGLHEDVLEWLDKIAPPSWAPAADEVAARAASRRRRLPPPPRRRGQRRRPPQEPARPPPGDRPRHRRPPRPRPLAAGLLLRVRRRPPEAAGDQGDGGVRGRRHPGAAGRRDDRRPAALPERRLRIRRLAALRGPAGPRRRRLRAGRADAARPRGARGRPQGLGAGAAPDGRRPPPGPDRAGAGAGASATRPPTATASAPGRRSGRRSRTASDELRPLVERPVQTNEVGRCAALLPGFLDVAARTGMPLRMLEVGASAGLNLGWSEYRYEAGDFAWGPPDSALRIEFELVGGADAGGGPGDGRRAGGLRRLAGRPRQRGGPADPALLRLARPGGADGAPARGARDRRRAPGRRSSAAARWSGRRRGSPSRRPGCATILFHSIVMQYLSEDERDAFARVVAGGGLAGGRGRPARLAADGARRRTRRRAARDLARGRGPAAGPRRLPRHAGRALQ